MQLVRRAVPAYQRRDAQALRAISHEDGEIFTLTWDEFRVEPTEIRDVGDRVLMRSHVTASGKGSSVELIAETGSVFESRDGKIFRMRAYLDWNSALEAMGLVE